MQFQIGELCWDFVSVALFYGFNFLLAIFDLSYECTGSVRSATLADRRKVDWRRRQQLH